YSECLDTPTKAAKSPAGRPLRCQVSSNSSRCSAVNTGAGEGSFLTSCRPRIRLASLGCRYMASAASVFASARTLAPSTRGPATPGAGDGEGAGLGRAPQLPRRALASSRVANQDAHSTNQTCYPPFTGRRELL